MTKPAVAVMMAPRRKDTLCGKNRGVFRAQHSHGGMALQKL